MERINGRMALFLCILPGGDDATNGLSLAKCQGFFIFEDVQDICEVVFSDDAASFAQARKGVVNASPIDGGVRCVGNDDFWRDGCPQSVDPCVGGVSDAGEWQGVFFFERGNCGWGGEPIGEYADEFELFRCVLRVQFFERYGVMPRDRTGFSHKDIDFIGCTQPRSGKEEECDRDPEGFGCYLMHDNPVNSAVIAAGL